MAIDRLLFMPPNIGAGADRNKSDPVAIAVFLHLFQGISGLAGLFQVGDQVGDLFGGAEDLLPLDGVGDLKDALWSFDGSDWTRVGP